MNNSKALKYLLKATKILNDSGICPESSRSFSEWFKMVRFAHNKGYLYVGFTADEIDIVAVGYKVKKVDSKTGDVLPAQEEGNILYVPLLASNSKSKTKVVKLLRYYLKINPDVNRIAYHWRGKLNDLRQKKLRRKYV